MDINKIKSKLQMKNFYFNEIKVTRERVIADGEMKSDVSKFVTSKDEHCYDVSIVFTINKSDFQVYLKATGEFIYEGNPEREQSIINTNTVAIMFPFIRSQVTLITSQPNMTPIILPAINTENLI